MFVKDRKKLSKNDVTLFYFKIYEECHIIEFHSKDKDITFLPNLISYTGSYMENTYLYVSL